MFEHRTVVQRLTDHDRAIAELREQVARLEALFEDPPSKPAATK